MVDRLIPRLMGCVVLCLAIGACSETTDGPTGVDSCSVLADLYVASYQDAIDAAELADPELPDDVDSGLDQDRLDRIFHIIGGLDWVELHSEIALRWAELACEPVDLVDVLRDRVEGLSYETPVGEYLVEDYFEI